MEVQLSTNIGEDQLLFDRTETGHALQKSLYEIAGKAAQSALGVALSMSNDVHECPIVKVGVDGMPVEMVRDVLEEVVLTVRRTRTLRHSNIMSVLFAQDLDLWDERKGEDSVRQVLIGLNEFHYSESKDAETFDLLDGDYLLKTLRDSNGAIYFQ